jgi:hypothetical protein
MINELEKKFGRKLTDKILEILRFDSDKSLEDFSVHFKRVDRNIIKRKGLYFAHSWAGREVDVFIIILKNGEIITLPFLESYTNGWHSEWSQEPPSIENFLEKKQINLSEVKAIIEVIDETFNKKTSDEFIREIIVYKNN